MQQDMMYLAVVQTISCRTSSQFTAITTIATFSPPPCI